jgi:hypothetical protein
MSLNPFAARAKSSAAKPGSTLVGRAQGSPQAWQPFTFSGVAAFGRGTNSRLSVLLLVMCAISGLTFSWLLSTAWAPVLRESIRQLPDQGWIVQGELVWTHPGPLRLQEGKHLGLAVDPFGTRKAGAVSDLFLEFSRQELRIHCFAGNFGVPYPQRGVFPLNRTELQPWWGAWEPGIFVGAALFFMIACLVSWIALASLWYFPAKILAFYLDRDLSLAGCWRCAAAALVPGAALMCLALVFYGLQQIQIFELLLAFIIHLILGCIYTMMAVIRLPRIDAPSISQRKKNPFAGNA